MNKTRPASSGLPESQYEIRRRYEDVAVQIFKENQKGARPGNFLSYGATPKSYAYSSHGNHAVVVHRKGNTVTKADEKGIESKVCAVM